MLSSSLLAQHLPPDAIKTPAGFCLRIQSGELKPKPCLLFLASQELNLCRFQVVIILGPGNPEGGQGAKHRAPCQEAAAQARTPSLAGLPQGPAEAFLEWGVLSGGEAGEGDWDPGTLNAHGRTPAGPPAEPSQAAHGQAGVEKVTPRTWETHDPAYFMPVSLGSDSGS